MNTGSIKTFLKQLNKAIFLVLLLSCLACQTDKKDSYRFIHWVNPLIGTAPLLDTGIIGYTPPEDMRVWAGLTFPGASLPNAMVQLSPITRFASGAGYEYENSVIYAFAHTNLGHWNLCHIPVLPVLNTTGQLSSRFSHDREIALPGYYQVYLDDFDIDVELTATLRAGFHKYKYTGKSDRKVAFNLSKSNEKVREWHIEMAGSNAVSGFQDTGRKIFFFAEFNHDVDEIEQISMSGSDYSIVNLPFQNEDVVEMKIGLSFVSEMNAKENLEAEIADKTFEQVKLAAFDIWEEHLGKIEVTGGTDQQREMFYSSLYRSFLWPALRSDVNGEFTDTNGNVVKGDFNYYTVPALWDTYRNKLVLLGMFSPEVANDVIRSLIDIGDKTGFIPTYFHGDHAAAFIAGSYLRGINDYDIDKAYQLLLRNATVEGGTRPYIKEYMEKGYISTPEVENPHVETKAKAGVTKTLEYAYDDYAVALLARQLNDTVNYRRMMERSMNYRNVFDATTGFMRGRLENGDWVKNFNPQYPYYEYMYREANAWQSTFFVPHDVEGLIDLYGGVETLEKKLDSLFSIPWNSTYIAWNLSGFIGQYCHGNQPNHNFPYLYYHLGKQEKSQHILDTIMNHYYGIGEQGLALCGMDDAGEMSSWYVFNAMGFYPFSPADDDYVITVPLFDEVTLKMPGDSAFHIIKKNDGKRISKISLNGREVDGFKLLHRQLKDGGSLVIE